MLTVRQHRNTLSGLEPCERRHGVNAVQVMSFRDREQSGCRFAVLLKSVMSQWLSLIAVRVARTMSEAFAVSAFDLGTEQGQAQLL